VRAALTLHNLPGKLLAIELTESALIENKKIIKQNLAQLRELGVQIFLDDFGTGYSSLSILQDFPIDVLKIDRSFIIGVDDNNLDSQNLVKAMIKMAQALNMEIVAEGVENLTTYNWLQKENCDLMQGYYFSKPMPEHALQDYIQQYIASQSFAKISISTVI
jgi:EAL domain-containing protein (putative c-di-GMP-specific phosphodiesterase class I)